MGALPLAGGDMTTKKRAGEGGEGEADGGRGSTPYRGGVTFFVLLFFQKKCDFFFFFRLKVELSIFIYNIYIYIYIYDIYRFSCACVLAEDPAGKDGDAARGVTALLLPLLSRRRNGRIQADADETKEKRSGGRGEGGGEAAAGIHGGSRTEQSRLECGASKKKKELLLLEIFFVDYYCLENQ